MNDVVNRLHRQIILIETVGGDPDLKLMLEEAKAEIARLREDNETLRGHWPTFWKPLPVAVKEVGRE